MSEAALSNLYLTDLEPHFYIEREITGSHFSGKRLRLDAVLKPKAASMWKREDVAFGIEFKDTDRFAKSYDTKNLTQWLAQCIDYANTNWDNFGYLYIFCCPSLVDEVPESVLSNPMFATVEIAAPVDEKEIEIPPYFPTYSGLTPEQKWIYLKLLSNPYDTNVTK